MMFMSMADKIGTILTCICMGVAWVFIVWATARKADDPARMVFKWILTAGALVVLLTVAGPMAAESGPGAIFALPIAGFCSIVMFITWRHSIGALVAKPFSSLYDGGDIEPEPQPFYSIARARQKQGQYQVAVGLIEEQLQKFPTDLEGQLLLAQIQAENLHDLEAADLTIDRLCAQPGHAAKNLAFALYSLADWYLSVRHDPAGARSALEKIIARFPDTEFSLGAAQRIAHLSSAGDYYDPHEAKTFSVKEGLKNIGLQREQRQAKAPEEDPKETAAKLAKHLEIHPLDTDARERLAVIYADTYGRLDLATDQLESMIAQPNQPGRLVARWLNLLADIQVRSNVGYDGVRNTLERIIARDEKSAAAELARKRLALLKLEFKGNEKRNEVKMGTYEQNLGLKSNRGPLKRSF